MGPYPLSSLPFDLGFTLLALALFRYGSVLGLLLKMMKHPRVDLLLHIAGILLLVSVAIHAYTTAFVLPLLDGADPDSFDALYTKAMDLRKLSLAGLLTSGLLSSLTGGLYYRWINR